MNDTFCPFKQDEECMGSFCGMFVDEADSCAFYAIAAQLKKIADCLKEHDND